MVNACEPLAFERELPTWEEVVQPGPGWPVINSIPRKTSAGYPYCLDHTGGKKDFFGKGEEYDFGSAAYKELIEEVEYMESQMKEGKRPFNVCMSFLKDERRPVDRVKAGKTRLISASNVAFSMIMRKYTMGFIHFVTRGRLDNGVAVGTNPYSQEWGHLASLHGETKDGSLESTVAGDYSGFDKKMVVAFIQKFGDLLDKFYSSDDHTSRVVRRVIIEELCYSLHVVGDKVIEWFGSNPSGNIITVILNSIVGLMKTRMAITERYCKFNEAEFTQGLVNKLFVGPDRLFETTSYGDDGLATRLAKLKSLEWFGQEQMTIDFKELFGDDYTNESKGKSETKDLRKLRECTFLKRGFKYGSIVPGKKNHWLSPLEVDTIYGSVMWTKKTDEDLADWRTNVRGMLLECSAHDADTFRRFYEDVAKGLPGQFSLFEGITQGVSDQAVWQTELLERDERL